MLTENPAKTEEETETAEAMIMETEEEVATLR